MKSEHVVKYYKMINSFSALVTIKRHDSSTPAYSHGCMTVAAEVTAVGREMLINLALKAEKEGYIATYCDTDSLCLFPVSPHAKPIHEICNINSKFGGLKIEHSNIKRFISHQAKTYSLLLSDPDDPSGTKTSSLIKMKGLVKYISRIHF